MAAISDLWVRLGLDSKAYQKGLTDAEKNLQKFAKDLDRIGSEMQTVGATLTASITAPIVGIGLASLTASASFEQAMNKVSALGEITGKPLEELSDLALKLGQDTQYSAQQAADAMAELSAQGFTATEIMRGMPGTLALAASGTLALADAAQIASGIARGFGMDASEIGRAADVIAKGAAVSAANVQDMGLTFTYVGPIARAAGMDFEEMAGAVAILGNQMIKGEQAGTTLRGGLTRLLKPSKQAQAAFGDFFEVIKNSDGTLRPLADIIAEIEVRGYKTADMLKIFGQEAGTGMVALVNQGSQALRDMTVQMENSSGEAARMAKTMRQGLAGTWEEFTGSVETAGIAIGKTLQPAAEVAVRWAKDVIDSVTDIAKAFGQLPTPVQAGALAFVGVAAAIGPVILGLGTMAWSVSNMITMYMQLAPVVIAAKNAMLAFVGSIGAQFAAATGAASTALVALQAAAVAAGIAIAAIAIYTLIDKMVQLKRASDDLKGANATYEQSVLKLDKYLREHGIVVDRGKKSLEEWNKELIEASKQIKGTSKATEDSSKKGKVYSAVLSAIEEATNKAGESQKKLAKDFTTATDKNAVLVELLRRDMAERQRLIGEIADHTISIEKNAGAMEKLRAELEKAIPAHVNLGEAAKRLNDIFGDQKDALDEALDRTKGYEEALKTLGVSKTASDVDRMRESFDRLAAGLEDGEVEVDDYLRAWIKMIDAMIASGEQIEPEVLAEYRKIKGELGDTAKQVEGSFGKMWQQVSTIFTDMSRSIADLIFEGGSLKDVFLGTLEEIGKAIVRYFIEEGFKQVIHWIKGDGGLLDALGGIGAKLKDVFGGFGNAATGGAGDAIGGAVGGGGGAAGAGGAAGSAGGLLSGGIAAAGGVAGGLITGFMLTGDLGKIEENTRGTLHQVRDGIQPQLNQYLPGLEGVSAYLNTILNSHAWRIHDVWDVLKTDIAARIDTTNAWLEKLAAPVSTDPASGPSMMAARGGINFNNCTFSGVTEELVRDVFTRGTRDLRLAGAL